MESESRQQFDTSFTTELNDKTWTYVPTGDMPDLDGMCCHDENMIQLVARQKDKEFFESVVHETLHALFPWMKEFAVNNAGVDMTNLLWKFGYRRGANAPDPVKCSPQESAEYNG